ncbi:hypothetical protein FRC02_001832 [Tulasnella sp. 418]|nr:hypothetical protein FRC02_001832 [Tulasnella sp. 418]
MKKRMYSRIAREAVKAKINSHRFPNHRDLSPSRVANVISISALPDLQRYSTSNSLHGTSPLGQGTRENGLSYGKVNKSGMIAKVLSRIHLLFRKGEPKPYTPQRVRLEIFTPQPKGDKPTATATPFTPDPVTYRVQFVIRNGREEWGKKVEAA